jgi:uncharacterized protein YgbK (DUF1537 family)
MPQLVIVADDLTGAADTGACFASAGLGTVIRLAGPAIPTADVVVVSTESRDLDGAAAAATVRAAVIAIAGGHGEARPRWIYKKIDSALRGHPRDELLATMDAIGATRALVAPAFPAEGRTTIGGRQLIDGVPLESSRIGGAGAASDLVTLFGTGDGPPVQHIDLIALRGPPDALRRVLQVHDDSDGIVIADAETDDDLMTLAGAVEGGRLRLFCGSAGFARQLARSLPLTRNAHPPLKAVRRPGPILIVAGSRHEATARQVEMLRQSGIPIVRPGQRLIDDLATPIDSVIAQIVTHLAAGRSVVLTTLGLAPSAGGGHVVASRLAQMVAAPEVSSQVGGLVLTGGDVAAAVCTALGATAIWLGGEISSGIPVGMLQGGRLHARVIATKAGSFGGDNALASCIDHLTSGVTPWSEDTVQAAP